MADIESRLREITPSWGQAHVKGTITGNSESAQRLSFAMDDEARGKACILLVNNIPRAAYRALLADAWNHSHRQVIAESLGAEVTEFFEYAKFPADHFPEMLRVWRGTSAITPEQAASGFSWTTDRDTACWFAMRFFDRTGAPVVLAADIQRDEVLYSSNERQESEILLKPAPDWWIDGNAMDWAEGFQRFEAMKDKHNQLVTWTG